MYDNITVHCPECDTEYTVDTEITEFPQNNTYYIGDILITDPELRLPPDFEMGLKTPCPNCKTLAVIVVLGGMIIQFLCKDDVEENCSTQSFREVNLKW